MRSRRESGRGGGRVLLKVDRCRCCGGYAAGEQIALGKVSGPFGCIPLSATLGPETIIGDAEQPSAECGAAAKAVEVAVGLDKSVLRQVLDQRVQIGRAHV